MARADSVSLLHLSGLHCLSLSLRNLLCLAQFKAQSGTAQSAVWHSSKRSLAQFKAQSETVQSAVRHSSKCSLAQFKAQSGTVQSAVRHSSKCSLAQFKAQSGPFQSVVWPISKCSLAQFKAQSGTFQSAVWHSSGRNSGFSCVHMAFHRSRWTIFARIDDVYMHRIAYYWHDTCIFDTLDSDCYKVIVMGI